MRTVSCSVPWARAVAILSLCVHTACGGAAGSGAPTGPAAAVPALTLFNVSLPSDTIEIGASVTATAIGLDQNGKAIDTQTPTWSTTAPGIATVDQLGIVTAIASGQTTLVASANGKQGKRSLTIVPPAITRVLLAPEAARLVRGATLQLSVTALDAGARALVGRRIEYASSDARTASVTTTGLVTALSAGAVTITATGDRATASAAITVTATPDSVATVSVNVGTGVMTVGSTLQLGTTLRDAGANLLTGRSVTWSLTGTGGQGMAVVSDSGVITALAPGVILVEASAEGQHGSARITVKDNLDTGIVVTFAAPTENQVVGDTLLVIVNVRSPHRLSSVIAEAGPFRKQVALVLRPVGALGSIQLWVGSIDVTDLATGPYQVAVTATDATGARGVGVRLFTRDTRTGKGGSSQQPKQK